jgi:hypothetical protein
MWRALISKETPVWGVFVKFVVGLGKGLYQLGEGIVSIGKALLNRQFLILVALVAVVFVLVQFVFPMIGWGAELDLTMHDALQGEIVAFGGATPGDLQTELNPPTTTPPPPPVIELPGNDEQPPPVEITFWGSIWTDRTGLEKFLEVAVLALINQDMKRSGGGGGGDDIPPSKSKPNPCR